MKKIIIALSLASLTLLNSCQQTVGSLHHNMTRTIAVDSEDVRLVVGRAKGSDTGCCLLGIFPLWLPSKTDAIDDMYDYCREIGQAPEGKSRTFANTTIDTRANYFILLSFPTVRATGDLIEFTEKAPVQTTEAAPQSTNYFNVINNNNY